MYSFQFQNVYIESMAVNMPPNKVTTAELMDKIKPVLRRLFIPMGTFEKLTGVQSRYFWEEGVTPSQVATVAAHKALEDASFGKEELGALFNCSITRDYFEPATATIVHNELGLSEQAMTFDISNACLGFMNGIMMMSNLIESGVIKAGILVSGETIERPFNYCVKHILQSEKLSRSELIKLLPTLTLGSGSVSYVLCNKDLASPSAHRIVGGVARSASQHHDLCEGNGDYYVLQEGEIDPLMSTESSKIVSSAAELGSRTWPEVSEVLGWSKEDVDHIFCHQVGKQVNKGFYKTMGLDQEKEFTIYERYGNLASAALPSALAIGSKEKEMHKGEKVLMTGFGSGLNSLFLGLEW
ncbi:MAG: 3-oxoacyl-ACP synthase III [Deltaproteobacteria bacterium]|nr:3-oxoacyl-ACP synthase III [Deltaproteobacteria bacterium]